MDGKWKQLALALGSIRAGEKKNFFFETSWALENISEIIPSCPSCTKIQDFDPESGKLHVEFSSGKFPVHLELEGKTYYETTKHITVKYLNSGYDKLYFTIRVYK